MVTTRSASGTGRGGPADDRRFDVERLQALEEGRGDSARPQDRQVASAQGAALFGEPPVGTGVDTDGAKSGYEKPEGELGDGIAEGALGTRPGDPGSVQVLVEQPIDPGRWELHPLGRGSGAEPLREAFA
jgi:hypothetical protein